MAERKKPSSLRTRVDRSRKVYHRKSSPLPMVIGLVAIAGVIAVLAVVMGGGGGPSYEPPPEDAGEAAADLEEQPGSFKEPARTVDASAPPKKQAYQFCFYRLEDAKRDPDKALADLKGALGRWSDYDPEVYFTMAMVIENQKLGTATGAARDRLIAEKIGHLETALDLVEKSGKKWAHDPANNKSENVATIIRTEKP